MGLPTHQLLFGAAACMTLGLLQLQFPPNELPSLVESNYTTPKYLDYALFYMPIETGYDVKAATDGWRWMKDNRLAPAIICTIYLLILAVCQCSFVDPNSSFKLKKPLQLPRIRTAWNLGLAIFSVIGFSRVAPAIFVTIQNRGFTNTICSSLDFLGSGPSGLWTLAFTLSKVAELGDTFLLLIHGKELSFLHVFHHSTVLLWGWQQYIAASGPNFIYTVLNLFVHSLMYSYFAIAEWKGAANLRTAAIILTATQCTQFVIALVVSVWAAVVSLSSEGSNAICAHDVPCSCRYTLFSIVSSLFFYSMYLILFLNFANKAYAIKLRLSILFNGSSEIKKRPWTNEKLSLEQKFKTACSTLPLYKSNMTPEDGIKLYGLYKQATAGDINANDLEISKIATDKGYNDHTTLVSSDLDQTVIKCAAWEIYHGKNSEECMNSYVSLVNDISFRDNGRKKLKKI